MSYPSHIEKLVNLGNSQFSKRGPILSMWQEIAENFYCERADFTLVRNIGADYAAHLTTSYPLLVSRDLGNTFSGMLRPRDKDWFSYRTDTDDDENPRVRGYLEKRASAIRRAIYDPLACLSRATKEGDRDFTNFGQCVISLEINLKSNTILYRCWHLRDVCWLEDYYGSIDRVFRKCKIMAGELVAMFKNTASSKLKEKAEKDPYCEVSVMHIVVPAENYGGDKKSKHRWMSIYIDTDNETVLEETGRPILGYVIPRWQTISGSQYAVSPAAVCALPDARLLQSMALILLEAGEKSIDPAMIAQEGTLSSDVRLYSGGITFVDRDYDERLGEALRPIPVDKSGLQYGLEIKSQTEAALRSAFFLDKIDLPPSQMTREMTAFETSQRVQQYIRNALPLFEPMEHEYNGKLLDQTDALLDAHGAFGNPQENVPPELSDKEIHFVFRSPLTEGAEREKGQRLQEATAVIANSIPLYPAASGLINFKEALRDGLNGLGTPANWINTDEEIDAAQKAQQQAQQQQQLLGMMTQGAEAAAKIGQASEALQGGGMLGG